jgi:hypothetical protein
MKKLLMIVVLFIITSALLAACGPIPERKDIHIACQELYDGYLVNYEDLSRVFFGYCVATLQSGKPLTVQGICQDETIWQIIEDEHPGISIDSRQECVDFFEVE